MKRPEILDEAKKIVSGRREQEYGAPEDSFTATAALWTAYINAAHPECAIKFSPKDVAMMLGCLKVARIARGDKPDSFIDLAGYAACAGEIATQEFQSTFPA